MRYRIPMMLFALSTALTIVNTQSLYFKAGGDYRRGMPTQYVGADQHYSYYINSYSNPSQNYNTSAFENQKSSLGNGLGIDGSIGLLIDDHFGIEVGMKYIFKADNEWTIKNDQTYFTSVSNSTTSSSTLTRNYTVDMFALSPSAVFTTNIGLYGRAGISFAFPKGSFSSLIQSNSNSSGNYTEETVEEATGNAVFGLNGALGIVLGGGPITPYIEAEYLHLNWGPERMTVVKKIENGIDKLPALDERDKTTVFTDEYTDDSRVNNLPTQPRTERQLYFPLSSFGIKAGIMIEFGHSPTIE